MTKFSKMSLLGSEKKEVETVFTHSVDENGYLVEDNTFKPMDWDSVILLDTKHDGFNQFIVNNEGRPSYIAVGKAGAEFDNL